MEKKTDSESERILIEDFSFISNNLQERICEKYQSGELSGEVFQRLQKLLSDFSNYFLALLGATK